MAQVLKAASASDLPPGSARSVTLNGIDVALFNVDGRLSAFDNACPHRGGSLSEGALRGATVTCPWHAWEFDVSTGACLNNPAAKLKRYDIQTQGNDILVTL